MKSYIKIYGPPIAKAIKALEKIAIDMPEVCIMNTNLSDFTELSGYPRESPVSGLGDIMRYFGGVGVIPEERCDTIISKSGESLGNHDFYFEWFKKPNTNELNNLIEKIDKTMEKVGSKYTITTR
jgi:hypothetical protein